MRTMWCEGQRVLDAFEDGNITMSTAPGIVSAAGALAIMEGEASTLVNTEHLTGALHVSKVTGATGEVRWQVPLAFRQDLAGFAHFNIRMGNRIRVLDEDTCTVVASAPPPEFTLVFEDGGGMEFPVDSATLDQSVCVQDKRIVVNPLQLLVAQPRPTCERCVYPAHHSVFRGWYLQIYVQ
jgi:hypothetical protein